MALGRATSSQNIRLEGYDPKINNIEHPPHIKNFYAEAPHNVELNSIMKCCKESVHYHSRKFSKDDVKSDESFSDSGSEGDSIEELATPQYSAETIQSSLHRLQKPSRCDIP